MKNLKTLAQLKEVSRLIEIVKTSCEQGISGEWDCSTDEGKEGFTAMIELLNEAKEKLK